MTAKNEIFCLDVNDEFYYFESIQESKIFLENFLNKKISAQLIEDIFSKNKDYYFKAKPDTFTRKNPIESILSTKR